MKARAVQVAVIGGACCDKRIEDLAFGIGQRIAQEGALLLCGGRGGVMAAAAAGAKAGGGGTLGILPGHNRAESAPNPDLDIAIFTGMGQARNLILVLSAAAVIGIGGGWGTLSEIALAQKHGIPVVLLESWSLEHPGREDTPLLFRANEPGEAVRLALAAAAQSTESREGGAEDA